MCSCHSVYQRLCTCRGLVSCTSLVGSDWWRCRQVCRQRKEDVASLCRPLTSSWAVPEHGQYPQKRAHDFPLLNYSCDSSSGRVANPARCGEGEPVPKSHHVAPAVTAAFTALLQRTQQPLYSYVR